jgi:hypothetical protein
MSSVLCLKMSAYDKKTTTVSEDLYLAIVIASLPKKLFALL